MKRMITAVLGSGVLAIAALAPLSAGAWSYGPSQYEFDAQAYVNYLNTSQTYTVQRPYYTSAAAPSYGYGYTPFYNYGYPQPYSGYPSYNTYAPTYSYQPNVPTMTYGTYNAPHYSYSYTPMVYLTNY